MIKDEKKIIARDKKIHLNYEIDQEWEVGLVLRSEELKSLRKCSPSLQSAFVSITNRELFVRNLSLINSTHPERPRKLLLRKNQIIRIIGLESEKGHFLLLKDIYEKKGLFKATLVIAKKLKLFDKRQKLKEKDTKRSEKFVEI